MSLRQLTKSEVPCWPTNAPHRHSKCRLLLNRYHMLLNSFSHIFWHMNIINVVFCVSWTGNNLITLISDELLQSIVSPQSPDAEPSSSLVQVRMEPPGHCSREVQVPPTPSANHNQEDSGEDTYGNSRMYLSGQNWVHFCPSPSQLYCWSFEMQSCLKCLLSLS